MAGAFGRQGRPRLTLVVLTLASVTIITLDYRDVGLVESGRDSVVSAVGSASDALSVVTDPIGDAFSGLTGYDDLEAENEELRAELEELRADAVAEDDARLQLEELEAELDIAFIGELDAEVARVVELEIANFDDHYVHIDKGSEAGIEVGNPVVTSAGLVGIIDEVTNGRSTVHLITDPTFNVGVTVNTDAEPDHAVAEGTGFGEPLAVRIGVEPRTLVEEGDDVVTSSISSLFPASIPVGRVSDVRSTDDSGAKILELRPAVDFDDLGVVQVLHYSAPTVGG